MRVFLRYHILYVSAVSTHGVYKLYDIVAFLEFYIVYCWLRCVHLLEGIYELCPPWHFNWSIWKRYICAHY